MSTPIALAALAAYNARTPECPNTDASVKPLHTHPGLLDVNFKRKTTKNSNRRIPTTEFQAYEFNL